MVIPEIGLEEEPMRPTMLEETVTKKKPKTKIIAEESRLTGMAGMSVMKSTKSTQPTNTKLMGRSFSVRNCTFSVFFWPWRRSLKESLKAATMVGMVLISVIVPPKVTAPTPM